MRFANPSCCGPASNWESSRQSPKGPLRLPTSRRNARRPSGGVRILCDNLTIGGFLTKTEGKYANTEVASVFLNSHSPAYMGGMTEFLCTPEVMSEMLLNFTDAVRKGGTMLPGEGTVTDAHPIW